MGGRGPPRGPPRLPPPPGAAVTYEMLQNMLDAQTARMEEALRTRTATVSAQIADQKTEIAVVKQQLSDKIDALTN